jgi:hypothetical protein
MQKKHIVSYMTKELADNTVERNTESFRDLAEAVSYAQKLSRRKIIGTKAIIGRPTVE